MKLEEKSDSFKFHKSMFSFKKSDDSSPKKCRKKLQDRFNDSGESSCTNRSVLTVLSLNSSRKLFRTSADKLHKSMNDFRTSLNNFTQRFRGTRRRHILEESNCTGPLTPATFSKNVLGRTPTKLYSPFGIESPNQFNNTLNESVSSEKSDVIKVKLSKTTRFKRLIMMR